jgi:hypothetical protein
MKVNLAFLGRPHLAALMLSLGCSVCQCPAEWQRTDRTLAWREGTNTLWEFHFDPQFAKPFFHPLAAPDGTVLTHSRPADHRWHYGLWFSWKHINGVNYWEENRTTGHSDGATRWSAPEIETNSAGGAVIRMDLTYASPTGRVDMTESRVIHVTRSQTDAGYTIDWHARFKAGRAGAVLDRTAMPGEPNGQVNGGYAGLGLRLAGPPIDVSLVCSTGAVTHFVSDRARPSAPALGCNLANGTNTAGGIAILSDPANAGENAPWYMANSSQMRFACAAILAPKVRTLKPGEEMTLNYRIVVRSNSWTPETLQAAITAWRKETP